MNGLRLYIKSISPERRVGTKVFYSRRANGPYYRWFFEEDSGRWEVSRLHAGDFMLSQFALAPWKRVPSGLRARLNEHYME